MNGLGSIKDYTPNYKFILPRFDLATWHDYIEANFRSIDALFYNLYEIYQYKGMWLNSTTYKVNDKIFVNDENSIYNGKIFKVLVNHTTSATSTFSEYYAAHPLYYTLYSQQTGYVHLDGEETIIGEKTFQQNITIEKRNSLIELKNTAITTGIAPSDETVSFIRFNDSNGRYLGTLRYGYNSNKHSIMALRAYKSIETTDTDVAYIEVRYQDTQSYVEVNANLKPNIDDNINLGNGTFRWKQLYAGTTTIATSDERLKQQIEDIPDNVLEAWGNVHFYQFKFNNAVAEKGEEARLHTGMIAQRIKSVFEAANIDPFSYGLLCYDEWEAMPEEIDDDGVIHPAIPAGNRYSLRYEECLCMEAAYQRYKANKLEQRLQTIENLLNINNNQGEN